ncbi:MAG: radical SAM family heme chaperone HemW, partial [Butyricicoccaceae bacterium]
MRIELYLHIPFCAQKCAYCDFYSLSGSAALMDEYCAMLCRELAERAPEGCEVTTIYFGGGTPSLLGAERIARILDAIRARYQVAPDAEITCEANPDSMTETFLCGIRSAGVNRLSMGIQSADDRELNRLGRIHTFAQAQAAFARARAAGFGNISVDLMYGLPDQTLDGLKHSVEALLALEPEHLSCYALTLEPDTPLGREQPELPDEDVQAEMYRLICETARAHGMEHYEISNFARPGFRSRHNSGYWNLTPYLGFGPGAHSDFGGKRLEHPRDLAGYLNGSIVPETEDEHPDRRCEYVMLGLRTSDGICADEYDGDFAPAERVLSGLPQYAVCEH